MEEKRKVSNIQKGKRAITDSLIWLSDQAMVIDELFDLWRYHGRFPLDPKIEQKIFEQKTRKKAQERLRYLKEKELIKVKKIEGQFIAEITEKGKSELVARTMKERPKLGLDQVCLVIYDFPVGARKGRDAFRNFLRRAGCKQVQKSVWKSDRDIVSDIQRFVKQSNVAEWVEIFVSKKC